MLLYFVYTSLPSHSKKFFFFPMVLPLLLLLSPNSSLSPNRKKKPGAFFRLFFCTEMMVQICKFSDEYAQQHGPNRPYFFKNWQEVTPEELYTFLGLLMYMSIIQAPNIELYWSVLQLFHGLWARAFMSRFRYKQIQCL